jgi:hypothetical protein
MIYKSTDDSFYQALFWVLSVQAYMTCPCIMYYLPVMINACDYDW